MRYSVCRNLSCAESNDSVTRLLKASKNEKPPKDKDRSSVPSRRNSVMSQHQHFASSSSLSLSVDHPTYAPNASLPTSNKLAAAQTELQACEAHLAAKERELELIRVTTIRDGLRIRCSALVECGRVWLEMGKEGLHALEGLQVGEGAYECDHLMPKLVFIHVGDYRGFAETQT